MGATRYKYSEYIISFVQLSCAIYNGQSKIDNYDGMNLYIRCFEGG